MIIDVKTKWNYFDFLRFLGNNKEFSGEFFALSSEKFSHFFQLYIYQSYSPLNVKKLRECLYDIDNIWWNLAKRNFD